MELENCGLSDGGEGRSGVGQEWYGSRGCFSPHGPFSSLGHRIGPVGEFQRVPTLITIKTAVWLLGYRVKSDSAACATQRGRDSSTQLAATPKSWKERSAHFFSAARCMNPPTQLHVRCTGKEERVAWGVGAWLPSVLRGQRLGRCAICLWCWERSLPARWPGEAIT